MNERYLWDRSGEPDQEVESLEHLLKRFQESAPERNFGVSTFPVSHSRNPRARWWITAVAALLLIGSATAVYFSRARRVATTTPWALSVNGLTPSAVHAGQIIETAALTHGRMQSEQVGEVEIEPNSRLRVLEAHDQHQQLALDHGKIHALIWAPPAEFVVDTPSAKTVDLGCQYTLEVQKNGNGFLTVETGWVAFQSGRLESFIPDGAACLTRPGHGPDSPYFLDASETFKTAVAQFESTRNSEALKITLAQARPRDALTLWHLLQRTEGTQRSQVFDRFSQLVALPSAANRDAVLRGDPAALDAAWNALNLGDTQWWREWKRQW